MKVYAYITTEGTAMAEAAYCEHHPEVSDEVRTLAEMADDCPTPPVVVETEGNEALFCYSCGKNSYEETSEEADVF